jgi:hypothetical protein
LSDREFASPEALLTGRFIGNLTPRSPMDFAAFENGDGTMHRRAVSNQKFRIGQMVDFVPSKTGVPASARSYKIMRVLPLEGGEQLYRIKTITEAFERIARESELLHS